MKKCISFLFVLFFCQYACFALGTGIIKADSLISVLKKDISDTTKVNTLNLLAIELMDKNLDTSIYLANQAQTIAIRTNDKLGLAKSFQVIGKTFSNLANYEKALKNCYEALSIYDKLLLEIPAKEKSSFKSKILRQKALTYKDIGVVFGWQGNYPEALKNSYTSLQISEEIGDKFGIGRTSGNIAYTYFFQGNFTEALKTNQYSLRIKQEIDDKVGIGLSYDNIGCIYLAQRKYPEAMKNMVAALKIQEEIDDKHGVSNSYINIGKINLEQGNYQEALKYLFMSIKLLEEIGRIGESAVSYNLIGKVYLKQKKYSESSLYLNKGLAIAQKGDQLEDTKDGYYILSELDSIEGNYKKSLEHYKLYIVSKDKIFSRDNALKTLQYKFDKNIAMAKAEQETKDALAMDELQKQKLLRNTFIVGLLIVIGLSFFIYLNYKKQHLANKALDETNHKLDESVKNLEVSNQILNDTQQQLVQQEKLASLGQLTAGIAHEIKNPLNFVNNFAELSQEMLEDLKTASEESEKIQIIKDLQLLLEKINEHGKRADSIIKNMLDHSRGSSGEKQLTNINLLSEEFFNLAYHGMRGRFRDFNCDLEQKFDTGLPLVNVIPQDISRVLLNLFNNAFYAVHKKSATENGSYQPVVSLKTSFRENHFFISVKDNGTGIPDKIRNKVFDPFFTTKEVGEGTGLGLSMSYDIVTYHGGEITLDTKENEYTEFVVKLPFNQ